MENGLSIDNRKLLIHCEWASERKSGHSGPREQSEQCVASKKGASEQASMRANESAGERTSKQPNVPISTRSELLCNRPLMGGGINSRFLNVDKH